LHFYSAFYSRSVPHNVKLIIMQSNEAITQMTVEECVQVGMGVDSFINDIAGLCESLSLHDCEVLAPWLSGEYMRKPRLHH
jgi:hypothetical protein